MTPQEHVIDALRETFGDDQVRVVPADNGNVKLDVVVRTRGIATNVAVNLASGFCMAAVVSETRI